jgi:hypothetical protein
MHDLRLFDMVFYKIMGSNAREVGFIWQQESLARMILAGF